MSLRGFLEKLKTEGKLREIKKHLSPVYEVSAAVGKEPALFTNVKGSKVAMNILASRELLAEALGVSTDGIIEYISSHPPDGDVKVVKDSSTKEIAVKPDLTKLPILTHFEGDGAPYITAGVVVSEYEGVMNASIHRLRVIGKDKLAARLVEFRHTYNLYKKAQEDGKALPVAIVIGIDPVTLFAVSTRVPEGKEFNYASALSGEPIELFECENGIRVPHAEIVLEGYIHPTELVDETLDALIPAGEAAGVHQILPDRFGVAASGEAHFDRIPMRFAGAGRWAATRLRRGPCLRGSI